MMPLHAAQRRSRFKCDFRSVRVIQIPDIGILRHVWRFLLESKLSISYGDSMFLSINLPSNFSYCTLDLIRVFEDHQSFSVNLFTHVFSLLTGKVLFKKVNFIVLFNATLSSSSKVFSSRCKAES